MFTIQEAADFSENLDKEGVLTEQGDEKEISTSSTEEKFGKVLEVAGFPVAKKYSEADLLKIGKKYGDVAGCCLVRSNRKVEMALIEMVNAADAAKLEAECKRQHIKLGGRNLRITVSKKYSQLNEGQSIDADSEKEKVKEDIEEDSKEPSSTLASSEESTVLMAEMEISEEDAEAQEGNETNMDTIMQTSSDEEESSNDVNSKADEMQDSAADEGNSDVVTEMQTPVMDPVGTEFVRPVVGYFCSLCNAIYASEEEAKDEHCRTPMHHQKLKANLHRLLTFTIILHIYL
ncbi:hypothetical protein cypCar_00010185 [Cyprinus carpio]|nr:hypothetical protein cypCar_00010185 [Cyprinus carpio]